MAFGKLAVAGLLLSLFLVSHALRDSSAHVDLDKCASEESLGGHQSHMKNQGQNKDLEAAEREVLNLMRKDYYAGGRGRKIPTSEKPNN